MEVAKRWDFKKRSISAKHGAQTTYQCNSAGVIDGDKWLVVQARE